MLSVRNQSKTHSQIRHFFIQTYMDALLGVSNEPEGGVQPRSILEPGGSLKTPSVTDRLTKKKNIKIY